MARTRNKKHTRSSTKEQVSRTNSRYPSTDNSKEKVSSGDPSTSDKTPDTADDAGKKNDISWYSRFADLLFAASNFSYGYPVGSPLRVLKGNETEGGVSVNTDSIKPLPGIMTVTIKNTVPATGRQNDPVNVAANSFYTHLRVVNSGRKNYDPQDSMIYLMSLADLFSYIFFVQKIYALGKQFSQSNRYIGKTMCEALGVDWNDLLLNLANLRYWLNTFAKKMQAYAVPATIPYYSRRAFMYSGIYLENDKLNVKDQLYQFKPFGFYKFALDQLNAGSLQIQKWDTGTLRTVGSIISYGENLISDLWADEDFALISGDIIKAYGSSLITVDEIPADFTVEIVHNPDVLAQIHNATIWSLQDSSLPNDYQYIDKNGDYRNFGDVYQYSDGQLFCFEGWKDLGTTNEAKAGSLLQKNTAKILNSEFDVATNEYAVEATRLMACAVDETVQSYQSTPQPIQVVRGGTEIVVGVDIATFDIDGSLVSFSTIKSNFIGSSGLSSRAYYIFMFKYCPMITAFTVTSSGVIGNLYLTAGVDAYTILEQQQIMKLHDVCLLSLFYVPGIAQFIESRMK